MGDQNDKLSCEGIHFMIAMKVHLFFILPLGIIGTQGPHCEKKETIPNVRVGKLRCVFTLYLEHDCVTVDPTTSKGACKPKGNKKLLKNFRINGKKGDYFLDFSIKKGKVNVKSGEFIRYNPCPVSFPYGGQEEATVFWSDSSDAKFGNGTLSSVRLTFDEIGITSIQSTWGYDSYRNEHQGPVWGTLTGPQHIIYVWPQYSIPKVSGRYGEILFGLDFFFNDEGNSGYYGVYQGREFSAEPPRDDCSLVYLSGFLNGNLTYVSQIFFHWACHPTTACSEYPITSVGGPHGSVPPLIRTTDYPLTGITKVTASTGEYTNSELALKSIQLTYGSTKGPLHGIVGEDVTSKVIPASDIITGVKANAGQRVFGLEFTTSTTNFTFGNDSYFNANLDPPAYNCELQYLSTGFNPFKPTQWYDFLTGFEFMTFHWYCPDEAADYEEICGPCGDCPFCCGTCMWSCVDCPSYCLGT